MVSAKGEIHYVTLQHNCVYLEHRYITNKDNRAFYMLMELLHIRIIMLHDDLNKSHFVMILMHIDIHVFNSTCRGQTFAIIKESNYKYVRLFAPYLQD